jgi:hypothetical protein
MLMMNVPPSHIKKLVKDYAAGKITHTDIKVTADSDGDITKDQYSVSLPTFDHFGDPVGTHDFSLTLESIVSQKAALVKEINAYIAMTDDYVANYDAVIAVLQDVKNKQPKKVP